MLYTFRRRSRERMFIAHLSDPTSVIGSLVETTSARRRASAIFGKREVGDLTQIATSATEMSAPEGRCPEPPYRQDTSAPSWGRCEQTEHKWQFKVIPAG